MNSDQLKQLENQLWEAAEKQSFNLLIAEDKFENMCLNNNFYIQIKYELPKNP